MNGKGKCFCVLMLLVLAVTACEKEQELILSENREEEITESKERTKSEDGMKSEDVMESEDSMKSEESMMPEETEQKRKPAAQICVFICGAVENPGVYYLQEGARLYEAVEAAGGFLQDADESWQNQASVLEDGCRVEIYTKEETQGFREDGKEPESLLGDSQKPEISGESFGSPGTVNINTADLETLQSVPGIGRVKAAAVLAYREENGPFSSVEDIRQVPGIKDGTFEKIKSYITIR